MTVSELRTGVVSDSTNNNWDGQISTPVLTIQLSARAVARLCEPYLARESVYHNHTLFVLEAVNHGLYMFDMRVLQLYLSFSLLDKTVHYDDRNLGHAHNIFTNRKWVAPSWWERVMTTAAKEI